ncbi:MAG TPA: hypothetical protein VM533_02230 [Fimbriiglobus sp.]|jgi:hypothetical protein|nr:hypothetical protein [Fimbriiglobus sp.]
MRNLLALIGAAVMLFAGLGWYLGWYTFALEPSVNGKQRIQFDVDTGKLTDDVGKFGEKVGTVIQGVRNGDPSKAQPAEFVGPPMPPDMPTRGAVAYPQPTPGQFTIPTTRR